MIEVIREQDALNREVWQFQFMDHHRKPIIILDFYYKQNRTSPRHKWVSEDFYSRVDNRQSRMRVEAVPLPDDVAQEALQEFMKLVRVAKGGL